MRRLLDLVVVFVRYIPAARYFFFFSIFLYVLTAAPKEAFSFDYGAFFSSSRIKVNEDIARRISGPGSARKDINECLSRIQVGSDLLSYGDPQGAEREFLKARELWPECFVADFLLALSYEAQGREPLAARYYKSYLNKLKALYSGEYRISAPILLSVFGPDIESYEEARFLVESRLSAAGIDLSEVRAASTESGFLLPAGVFILLCIVYVLFRYVVGPRIRKRLNINDPPEGFWICPNCEKDNPILTLECERCGRKRS